jgi:hypothetical protein
MKKIIVIGLVAVLVVSLVTMVGFGRKRHAIEGGGLVKSAVVIVPTSSGSGLNRPVCTDKLDPLKEEKEDSITCHGCALTHGSNLTEDSALVYERYLYDKDEQTLYLDRDGNIIYPDGRPGVPIMTVVIVLLDTDPISSRGGGGGPNAECQ